MSNFGFFGGECAVSTVFGGKCASSVVLTGDSVRDFSRCLVLEAIVPCGALLTEELPGTCLSNWARSR